MGRALSPDRITRAVRAHHQQRGYDTMKNRLLVWPYACARISIGVVDVALLRRLPRGSRFRTGFDCALGAFDLCAGQILHDPRITLQGYHRLSTTVYPGTPEISPPGPGPTRPPAPPRAHARTRPVTQPPIASSSSRPTEPLRR